MTDSLQTADAPAIETAAPKGDLMSKFDGLIAERQALLDSGVRDPFAIVMEKVLSPTEAVIKGRKTILLGTYNYMGMTFDPDVIQAGKDTQTKTQQWSRDFNKTLENDWTKLGGTVHTLPDDDLAKMKTLLAPVADEATKSQPAVHDMLQTVRAPIARH